ncbi:MAG: carboxypeptidase regulatory-like domain-containing protein [Terriglobales bacterium]
MTKVRMFPRILTFVFVLALVVTGAFAQETTGGLQGNVKDPTGAVVSHAKVELTGVSLVGKKESETDSAGYYRFANLPPGNYTLTVSAQGFSTVKRDGLIIEVGHLPSVDIKLEVGAGSTVVEVNAAASTIDVTTETTQTNITQDVVQDVPHGRSFQSVIQFAPSARNEPLAGSNPYNGGTGNGGTSPGNGSNGNNVGFMVAGGSDSENSYLVEGQETADLAGGFSHSNVPFDFIEEVQVKTSGVEAEHGGSLGGVVNVIMKKGSNNIHGSVFGQFENQALDGSPVAFQRYDPNGTASSTTGVNNIDVPYQLLQPIRPKTSDVYPGFNLGGPILKDRVFFFLGFNPEWNDLERTVNYGPSNGGETKFGRNTQTYFSTARIDASVSQKIRVFGSWLYQYQRQNGENLPASDSTTGLYNFSTGCFANSSTPCLNTGVPQFAYAHNLGYSAPNITTNFGADITITPRLVATTRFGYYFQNYHDFGFPTTGELTLWQDSGQGANDAFDNPLPSSLQQSTGYFNAAQNQNDTQRNADKAIQFDQDIAWFKSGWWGTHNFKFGYQLNRLSNDISQHWNEPATLFNVGDGNPENADYNPSATYSSSSPNGGAACAALAEIYGSCTGQYGYITIEDFGSLGKATSFNHGIFAQDAWTIGHGVTINAGVRFDKEYLPGEGGAPGAQNRPINFGWGDKIAPRIGAAWDVFKDGRMKVFGSYGRFYDIMKLNLAISSFGGQYWQNCVYALNTSDLSTINPVFNSSGRFCGGPGTDSTTEANFAGGTTPAGLTFIENTNFRAFPTTCSTCSATQEGVAPGLKPYEQHESVFGVDYQIKKNLAFEARWDRRRLDHVIEDSALYNPNIGETFVINNPGQGVGSTFAGFWNFLYGCSPSNPTACASYQQNGVPQICDPNSGLCPPAGLIPGARSYDGLELRLTKTTSNHWYAMASYTYSRLRGNYTGLTSTDIADGGGGRNAPNNSRSFDEPYFQFNANGGSSSGLLPTDRPNAFKGYAYYELPWGKFHNKLNTDFGLFQVLYSGTPETSYADVGYSSPGAWPVDIVNRGKWVDVTEDPTSGAVTVGSPRTFRTPWYIQSDFNIQQNYKVTERNDLSFSVTFTNLLNQHSVTAYGQQIDSNIVQSFMSPNGSFVASQGYYANSERPYNVQSLLNQQNLFGEGNTINSQYGKPYLFQASRNIRLGVKFTF